MPKQNKNAPASQIDTKGQEYVSMAELSRRIGVSCTSLHVARDRGKIRTVIRDGARCYPWPQTRDEYMATAKLMAPNSGTGREPGPTHYPGVSTGEVPEPQPLPYVMPSDPGSANASKATYSAALLQLEYEQRIGNMVPMDIVNSTWTGAGENLKKILMSIPDRIAPQFGGENHHKLYRALVEELTHALASLEIVYDFPAILKAGRPAHKQ